MFRWFQNQINKKKSDRPSRSDDDHSVEVATDAVFYEGARNTEEELGHMGGNAPSDLSGDQFLEQRQDALGGGSFVFYRKTQEAEGVLSRSVVDESPQGSDGRPAKCVSPNLSVDSSLSSMIRIEGVDAHHHCPQENSSSISSTHKFTEDALYAQKITGSSSSLQKLGEGLSVSESTFALQKYAENANSTQEHKRSIFSPQLTECPSNTKKCTTNISKAPVLAACQDSSNPHDFPNNTPTKLDVESFDLWSSLSLFPASSKSLTRFPPNHPYSPESSSVHERLNTLEESRKKDEEQENKTLQETDSECISEMNVIQKSGQYVDEVAISHLQQKVTPEKVRENSHNNEELLIPAAVDESVTHGAATGPSDQVRDSVPDVQLEREFTLECDKGQTKMKKNSEVAVIRKDKSSQTQNAKYECPNLYCYPQACLYNQKGRKCTVLGEHFILTYLRESPILVSTALQNTDTGPLGCMIVWCSGKVTEFRHLIDGTELYFDAVVPPKTPSFVALVIWQGTKPTYCVQPFYNCYVIVELIRNCPVNLVSFGKENGVVSTLINDETNIVFSKSVVYIDGKGAEKAKDIKDLSKSSSKQLYADVLRLMTLDQDGKVAYGFMCSCIWQGCKPSLLNFPLYDPFKLYRKTPGCFPVASKQALLLCDIDAVLEVEDTTYKITFKNEDQIIVLFCDKKFLFSGNQRVLPVSGKVKVHVRKGFAKNTYTWVILMVQVPPSLPFETTPNGTQPHHTNKGADQAPPPQAIPAEETSVLPHITSTKKSCESAVLPHVTDLHQVTSGPPASDLVLKQQWTSSSSFVRKGVKPDYSEAAVTSNNVSDKEHLKSLPESPSISERNGGSSPEEEFQAAAINVEEQVELIVKGNQSSHSESVISQDNQHAPLKVIKNSSGVLKNIDKAFILETQLQRKKVLIEMGKTPWVAFEDGKGEICQTPMPDLPVRFDAHFVDIPVVGLVGHILALWSGKKPLKSSLGIITYYFDAPGVYQGSDEKGCFRFMVLLEGVLISITTTSTTAIFEASGEQCASLTPLSRVFLHLSLKENTWTTFLVVLQPKHKASNLILETNSLPSKLSSLAESDTMKSSPPNSQVEAKTDNWDHTSITQKTAHEEGFTHYLKNLYGTLAETDGKRVVCTLHKNKPLTVEIPEKCVVDVNAVALNIEEIPIGSKLHVDAFCENMDSLRYWAAVVWLKKKARKSVALTGCIFHFNVGGRCLNSNGKEVSFEFILENKTEHVVCKNAYIIKPDGTFQALQSLGEGTPVHANLMQQNQNFSVNNFIYVDAAAAQPSLTSVSVEENAEKNTVTRSVTKTLNEEKFRLNEPPPSTLTDNLKKSEVKLESVAVDEKEVASSSPEQVTPENEYDVAKGTISQLKCDAYIFTGDNENLKVNINPMQIAIDPNVNPESGEFYLMYHKKTKVGMCGWYQHQPRQVYLQHGMVVHTHNLDSKVITLGLPDYSSLYNFLFDSEIIVMGNKLVCRFQQLKSGKKVHPIFEDINPILIDGCLVSHRIVLMTTIKGLSVVCLNFLKHSLFGNEGNKISNHGSVVSMNHFQTKDNNEPCSNNTARGHHEAEAATASLSHGIDFDALFRRQQPVKLNNELEGIVNESPELLSTSERYTCFETSVIQPQVYQLLDKYHEDNMPAIDGEGDTLRELVTTKHPVIVSKTSIMRYVTLCGEIRPGNSGTHVFCSEKLPSPVQITPNLPHCDANMCENKGKRYMLARKMCTKETGFIDHESLVVWPEERKCNPYIVVTYKVSRRKNLLLVTDAADEEEKCYLFDYNLVFSLKKSYKINEVIDIFSKQDKLLVLYAVVDKIPPFQIKEQYVEGNILLLTTSKNVAVSSIDVFIGSCHEEELHFQMPVSPVLQVLHLHKIRMDRALSCKRGSTCYFSMRDSSFNSILKSVGGCLEAHTNDFAIIRCDRKRNTAVCHLSNIYYQGENITSWETIPKSHWKNFSAIILPLDDTVQETKWEVNAVASVAWCCRGPRVLALHQCYYHLPTPYVPYFGTEESQEATPTNLVLSQEDSSHSSESCVGTGISLLERESWQCQAGNTIFAFNDSILQSCDLRKMSGKVTLVNGIVVIFTNTENEVVKCKISDIFIKGERCESVKKIVSEIDQTFTLVAQKCLPTIYLGRCIQMKVIIAFTASLKGTGIHICNKHASILENNLQKEEVAMAEAAFHDIAVLCKQSAKCSNYYLSKITISEDETPTPPGTRRIVKNTLCFGFVIGIDKESPDEVRVSLQQGSKFLTLPVSRSRLMGLHRNLSLHHAIGHPLKVILCSVTEDEREEYRILMGWGNFSKDSSMSPYSVSKPELPCSQKSKFHCCPRGLEVKEFQDLYNSNMFEVKTLYKLKKIDVESGRGFFHYWLGEKLITCKIEFIVGWLKVDQVQGELWNLLVAKGPQTGEECAEALVAWRGDCDSLVVEVCDVHGIHGMNISQEDKSKTGTISIPSSHKRGRRNSEPSQSVLPTSHQMMLPSRNRRNSEPLDSSLCAGITIEEENPVLSGSLPNRTDHPFDCGFDIRSRVHKKNLPSNSGSTTLLSIEEDSVVEERNVYLPSEGIEQFHHDQPLCTSSICDENDKNVMLNLESERDNSSSIVKPILTTITSDLFFCLDSQCGLIIDSLSHTVALVRQGRLYIKKTKPKESFKQLFSTCKLGIITALVVPLASSAKLADLKVTHEAVVAWLGSRPAGVGSMIKNIGMSYQPGNLLQDKTKEERKLVCNPDTPCNITSEVRKPDRGTLLSTTVTLKVLLRRLETVFGCFVAGYADNYGILLSSTGPVLFDKKLLNVTLQTEAASGTPQSDHKIENLKALVLELEQPIRVLCFEIENIAVVVWSEGKPVIDADFVARSLNVYQRNWNVEFIGTFDQLEMEDFSKVLHQNRVPSVSSKECNASEDIKEIVAICYPTFKEELCTVLSIEDNFIVFGLNEGQVLALWEDIWCQKEILQVGMELKVVCVEFSKSLTFFAHSFIYFAVLVYECDKEPEEASTIKSNWRKGTTEKNAQISEKVDLKIKTINLQVQIDPSPNTQPQPTDLELISCSLESVEDMTLADECELLKLMDECGILKMKNIKKIKVFFQKSAVLINNETLPPKKWKETLQMLLEQKQTWQCNGQKLTPQEKKNIKEMTGEEVQYKAELIWCTTGASALSVQGEATTIPGTALAPKPLSISDADLGSHTSQLTDDTDNNFSTSRISRESMQPSPKNSECPNTAHPGSLWAARPTLRIIPGKQETISKCIVKGYMDHCGILTSASGPILFDKNLINMTQQEEMVSGTSLTKQKKLKALVFELEVPVEILGCMVKKTAMLVWKRKKPEVDCGLLSKSLDIYRLKWIVVLIGNVSAITNNCKLRQSECHSFEPAPFQDCVTSKVPEVIYYCSQDYSMKRLKFKFFLPHVALFEDLDMMVLAMMDDVKCSEDYLKLGRHLWIITVKLIQSFKYFCCPITHFALLAYSGKEPPEAATIMLEWSRGKIEKVLPVKMKISSELESLNIRVKVDMPAEVKPYLMDPLWPLTPDRPEGDMIFAVECEMLQVIKNSGLLKVKGRLLKGKEIRIYFQKNVVFINSKCLSRKAILDAQLPLLQNRTWRCTGVRLKACEMKNVKETTGEEAQYKAKLVWCEICPSVQDEQIPENEDMTKATTSFAPTPPTLKQSGGAEAWTGYGQEEGMEDLCAVDTPLNTGTKSKKMRLRKMKTKNTKGNWDEVQQSTRMGRLTEVHRTVAQLALEDEQLRYVTRDKCFLYGLCLGKVELWHVLSIGLTMNYELTEDGKELKKVWLGDTNPSEPAVLLNTLRDWCLINNVSSSATTVLLLEAGWLPSELTPTVAAEENVDVVEVAAPRVVL